MASELQYADIAKAWENFQHKVCVTSTADSAVGKVEIFYNTLFHAASYREVQVTTKLLHIFATRSTM